MAKMPPPSYLISNRPNHRLNFPKPGDSSLFQNSGRKHYNNNSIFSTPYALFQDDNKKHKFPSISSPQSRNMAQSNTKHQQSVSNKYKQLSNNYVENDYDRMKKQRDALDRQVYNLQLNRQSQLYSRHKKPAIQVQSPQKQQYYDKQFNRKSQINVPQKNIDQYSTIQPKRGQYYPSVQQLPSSNPKKINRERIKTEAMEMHQQPQHRNSALNRYVRFNPTYLSWIN